MNELKNIAKYNMGWETISSFLYLGKEYKITVNATSYSEKDKVTDEQDKSYSDFCDKKSEIEAKVEHRLKCFLSETETNSLIPQLLKIEEDGCMALVFDICDDSEGSIVVVITEDYKLMDGDEYF